MPYCALEQDSTRYSSIDSTCSFYRLRGLVKTTLCIALLLMPALACSRPNPLFDPGSGDDATSGIPPVMTGTGRVPPGAADGDAGTETDGSADAGGTGGTGEPGGTSSAEGMGTTGAEATSDDDGSSETGEQPARSPRRVFLSSSLHTGAMGGIPGADGACQGLADAASLGGTWLAFLFDTTYTMETYPQSGGPFIKLNGEVVAEDWADLTDGSIAAPIDLSEQGDTYTVGVWTGQFEVPPASVDNYCYGWTSDRGICQEGAIFECGGMGLSHHTDFVWDGEPLVHCSFELHLYCIEVPAS